MRAFAYCTLPLLLVATSAVAAKPMVTANGSKPGTYSVKHADGTVSKTILMANGTYRDISAKGKVESAGKWAVIGGKMCFMPTTKGQNKDCYTESAKGKDGSFTATPDKGKPVTVTPVK